MLDTHSDRHTYFELDGFEERMLCHNGKGSIPWYSGKCIYIVLSFLALTWIQRYYLFSNTKKIEFHFKKFIA